MSDWQTYQSALAQWEPLLGRAATPDDLPQIERAIYDTYTFRNEPLIPLWQIPLQGPIRALRAADLDGDGQPELVVAAGDELLCFQQQDDDWFQLGSCPLPPPDVGRLVGLAVQSRPFGSGESLLVLFSSDTGNHLYEFLLPTGDRSCMLQPLPAPPGPPQPVLAQAYGDPHSRPDIQVVLDKDESQFSRWRHRVQVDGLYVDGRPRAAQFDTTHHVLALAHDRTEIFFSCAGSHVHRLRYSVSRSQLVQDDAWGRAAQVDGNAHALALLPAPQGPWLVLAATDGREVVAFDATAGAPVWRHTTPDDVLALDVLADRGQVVTGERGGQLCLYQVVTYGGPTPAAQRLEEGFQWAVRALGDEEKLLSRWLRGGKAELAELAVARLVNALPAHPQTDHPLSRLVFEGRNGRLSEPVALHLVKLVERRLLAGEVDLIWAFEFLRRLYQESSRPVRRRVGLLAARYVAEFHPPEDANYKFLRERRREGDLAEARRLRQQGDRDALEEALTLLSACLVGSRREVWLFAAEGPVSAVQPLPPKLLNVGDPCAVVGTTRGHVALLHLGERRVLQRHKLPDGDSVRALAVGDVRGDKRSELVLATAGGQLNTYPLEGELDLAAPARSQQQGQEVWSMALVGRESGQGAQLLLGAGQIAYGHFDEAHDRWRLQVLPREGRGRVPVTALEDLSGQGTQELIIGDAREATLDFCDVPTGERRLRLRFSSPVVAISPLNVNQSAALLAVACADGRLYLFDHAGRQLWRYDLGCAARAMEVFDVDGDETSEILVGGEDGFVHVFDADGQRLWGISTQVSILDLSGVCFPDGREYLLVADNERTLHHLEVLSPDGPGAREVGRLAAEVWEDLHDGQDVVARAAEVLAAAPNPFVAGFLLIALAERADGHDVATVGKLLEALLAFKAPDQAPPMVQEIYLRICLQALPRLPSDGMQQRIQERLVGLISGDELGPHALATALVYFPRVGSLHENTWDIWAPVLAAAARHRHAAARRQLVRLLRPFWAGEPGVDGEHPVWPLLRTALAAEPGDGRWVAKEVATVVRDRFLRDPVGGLALAHRLVSHSLDGRWLDSLGDAARHLWARPQARELFYHFGRLLRAPVDEKPEALAQLVAALDQTVASSELTADESLVCAYRRLDRLAHLRDLAGLRAAFSRGRTGVLAALEATCADDPLLAALGESLETLRDTVRPHLQRLGQEAFDRELEHLHRLASDLEAFRLAHGDHGRGRDGLARLWRESLSAIVRDWGGPHGPLGREINELSRTFRHQLEVVDVQVVEGEVWVDLRLANTGFVTVYDLRLEVPSARDGERTLACELDAQFETLRRQFKATQEWKGRVHIAADRELLDDWSARPGGVEIEMIIPLRYYRPPDRHSDEIRLTFSLSARTFRLVDYRTAFPSAWAHYSGEMKRLLAHHHGPVLVECERGARRSFFQALRGVLLERRHSLLDLREGYRVAAREHTALQRDRFAVRPRDLHLWLLPQVWSGVDDDLMDELRWGEVYQEAVRRIWRRMPEGLRPDLLFLDQFEYFLVRMRRTAEGRKALDSLLSFWQEWASEAGVQLVFGGTYLAEKIVEACYPALYQQMAVLRPDRLLLGSEGLTEATAFVQRELEDRGLERTLSWFTPPLTPTALVELCGGSLLYLRTLAVKGLEAAEGIARSATSAPRLGDAIAYFLDFAHGENFFTGVWVWLPFYEKLALTLVAHSEIALEEKKWLAPGLVLSRDYRPGAPDPRTRATVRSSKVVARAGEPITDQLAATIRSSRYFRSDHVWVQGLSSGRPSALEGEPTARMLLRLLQAARYDVVLDRLVKQAVLGAPRVPTALGTMYAVSIPLLRAWLRENGVLEHMLGAAGEEKDDWCPSELYCDQREGGVHGRLLFEDRKLGPVYQALPLDDLPRIGELLLPEELPLFLRFYGMKQRGGDLRRRWSCTRQLVSRLRQFRTEPPPPLQQLLADLYSDLSELLDQALIPCPDQKESRPVYRPEDNGVAWGCLDFGRIFPGFSPHVLVGLVADGARAPEMRRIRVAAERLLSRITRPLDPGGEEALRAVVFLLVQRHAEQLRQDLERRHGEVRYVVLDWRELAETLVDADPARRLLALGQNHIGRHSFSPYKLRGPLDAGSPLFVGREEEVERIRDQIATADFLIVGSRRIGKTSLLRHVQSELDPQRYLPLQINLLGRDTVEAFYAQLNDQLQSQGLAQHGEGLGTGEGSYLDLLEMVRALNHEHGRHPVFLMDEVDGLYHHDVAHNGQRFFAFLRNQLAQTAPRLCSFVMTGYQRVYLAARDHDSAFFNFCHTLNLAEVNPESARRLVDLLLDYGVQFRHREEATARILDGTFCIPWAVQSACDRLLWELDRKGDATVDMADVETVLTGEIDQQLREELLDELQVTYALNNVPAPLARLRLKIVLLAITLGKYGYRTERAYAHRRLDKTQRAFTPADVVRYLDDWAGPLRQYWVWTEEEVNTLLRALTITLAVSPEPDGRTYCFPQEILPTVLFRAYHREQEAYDIYYHMDQLIDQYRRTYASHGGR